MPTKEPTENLGRARCEWAGGVALLVALVGGLSCGLGGCSSSRAAPDAASPREIESTTEYAGSGSELVFSGVLVQSAEGYVPSEQTLIAARNDPRLAPRGQPNSNTRLAYPDRSARHLDQLRVIYLQPRPDRVEYFRDDERRRW